MSTPSLILQRRSPRHYYKPVVGEIIPTHFHFYPRCKEDYPGYRLKCEDAKELLCWKCLAEGFNAIN